MPHAHADPEIYIVYSKVTFCGLNRDGQYATVNLKPNTLVMISGGATHGIYK
jgi:cupin superfamily acireductone dioxygenase involved in methionine salvage